MNMLRGALTFLAVVALFVIVECKKTESENVSPPAVTAQTAGSAPRQAQAETGGFGVTIDCPDATSADSLCGSDPCIVKVDLSSTTVSKIWVQPGQTVKWIGANGGKDSTLDKLHFARKDDDTGPQKKGDKKLKHANCSTGDCIKTMSDATKCVAYSYTVFGKNGKKIDPDVEVGSATGTTTSGTAAHH